MHILWRQGSVQGDVPVSRIQLNDEQRRGAETLQGPVLIAAGAGSGKTRVLTERVVNALIPGAIGGWNPVALDQILAITFTDKAAGELAERVRSALRAAGETDAARRVDAAWISTIHGMCTRLLKAEALTLGIDPGFVVPDTVEAGRIREAAFEGVLATTLQTDPGVARLLDLYGFADTAKAVFALADTCRRASVDVSVVRPATAESGSALLEDAIALFNRTAAALCDCGVNKPHVSGHTEACRITAGALGALSDSPLPDVDLADELRLVLTDHQWPGSKVGISGLIKQADAEILALRRRAGAIIATSLGETLVRLTARYAMEFERRKRARSLLDFDDLQSEAARLLGDRNVAKRWRERFRLTMVDEFQDTDALQLKLVRAISGPNLCTVGDERQSIYRFRGADVHVYRRHNDAMREAGAEPIELDLNYRSHSDILAFVNALFSHETMFAGALPPLQAGRKEPEAPAIPQSMPRVELLLAGPETSSQQSRQALATAIAERVAGLVKSESRIVAGDVVVLVASYTHASVYANALRGAGVDAVVVGGSRFFEQPEVRALRLFARVVVNTHDEAAVGELLSSELLCGISDDGLLSLRKTVDAGGAANLWHALRSASLSRADQLRRDVVQDAVAVATDRLGRMPLAEVFLRAAEETGLDLRLLASGTVGEQAYANVLKFARMAGDFERASGGGMAAFSAYLDAKESYGEHEAPASLVGEGSEAVRIMSIHASKGLEFPVVVVPELSAPGNSHGSFLRCQMGDQPTISIALPSSWGDKVRFPPAFVSMDEAEKDAAAQESKRLLYVACTRAEEALILAGAVGPNGAPSGTRLDQIMTALEVPVPALEPAHVEIPGGSPLAVTMVDQTEVDEVPAAVDDRSRDDESAWFALLGRTPEYVVPDPEPPARLSYSGIDAYLRCGLRFKAESLLGMRLSEAGSATAATRLGTAVHAALQVLGETGALPADRLEAIARYNQLDDDLRSRLTDAIARYSRSTLAERVAAHPLVRREAPFSVRVGGPDRGFFLDGNIDVCAIDGDRALIVDYKTGRGADTQQAMSEKYELQASCYALAAHRAGAASVETVFVKPEEVDESGQPVAVSLVFDAARIAGFTQRLESIYGAMCDGVYEHREAWDRYVCLRCPVPSLQCAVKRAHEGEG